MWEMQLQCDERTHRSMHYCESNTVQCKTRQITGYWRGIDRCGGHRLQSGKWHFWNALLWKMHCTAIGQQQINAFLCNIELPEMHSKVYIALDNVQICTILQGIEVGWKGTCRLPLEITVGDLLKMIAAIIVIVIITRPKSWCLRIMMMMTKEGSMCLNRQLMTPSIHTLSPASVIRWGCPAATMTLFRSKYKKKEQITAVWERVIIRGLPPCNYHLRVSFEIHV